MGKLDGKVAVITGTTSGMGRATAWLFAEEGAKVVMGARRFERGQQMEKEMREKGYDALWVTTDVRIPGDCFNLVNKAVETYGRVDILVNDAGINGEGSYLFHESTDEFRDNMFKTDLWGVFDTCKAAIPHMLKQGKGSIVNVSSVAGITACPGDVIYSTVKGAVRLFSIAMAYNYGPLGIRVNCLAPGLTKTEMGGGALEEVGNAFVEKIMASLPLKRFGEAEEHAKAILYLASDDSSFCNGAVLVSDGGEIIA
jgi:NAD(P)-dependent dehydrogenase (short-subunit alcohol dehydrogenase family)